MTQSKQLIRLKVTGSQLIGESCLGDSLNLDNGQVCSLDIKSVNENFWLTWADLPLKEFNSYREAEEMYVKLLRKQAVVVFHEIEITEFYA